MSTLDSLTPEEREVVRRSMRATFRYFDWDFHSRLGVTAETMHALLDKWPCIDDADDESDACRAVNNTLNDLLNGVGISDQEAKELIGVSRAEMQRIYTKWAVARGWRSTGIV